MDGKIITLSHSSETGKSLETISILVVDDDTTCLAIVAAILKKWKYQVVTVKHPIDALCTLRIKGGSFDLVVSDVHMPDMNGFELQQQIDEEFKLPVVLMSADDKEGVMLKGLESGAAFFIVKPISPDDLRDIWQYAAAKKKTKAILEEAGIVQGNSPVDKDSYEDAECTSSVNEGRQIKKEPKRKCPRKDDDDNNEEDNVDSATPKRAKVVWTNALHNRFLEAIRSVGLERAVPKKILELMKVPGLTRENVASHLQKYRIFLKRVSDASYKLHFSPDKSLGDRCYQPTASHYPSIMLKKFRQVGQQNPEQQPKSSLSQRRLGGNVLINDPSLGGVSFPEQQDLCSNSITRLGYGQSRLLGSQGNLLKPIMGNTNPLYQANHLSLRMEPKNYQSGFSLPGGTSSGLVTGTNSIQMYPSLIQATPKNLNNGMSNNCFTTFGVPGPSNIFANGNRGNSSWIDNLSYCGTDYKIFSDEHLAGSGHMVDECAEASNVFNDNNCSINEIQCGQMIAAPIISGISGHLVKGASSSASFKIAKQFPSPFTVAIQRESSSVPQLPAAIPPQPNSFGTGGQGDSTFGLMNNSSNFDEYSLLQPYDHGDLSDTFLNQVNIQSPFPRSKVRQDGEEESNSGFSRDSYFLKEYPLALNQQTSKQQQRDEEWRVSNFCCNENQSNAYFPWIDQNPTQKRGLGLDTKDNGTHQLINTHPGGHLSPSECDDEEFLDSVFGPGPYEGDDNLRDI
ncbi:unnamed protein product [Ilex paraguariensis]|uniref:Two-component response regulator n=1 Tax=Ilex paraguariensis TaxID=185542 RepID=A0ABC8SVQ0_9AQUA